MIGKEFGTNVASFATDGRYGGRGKNAAVGHAVTGFHTLTAA